MRERAGRGSDQQCELEMRQEKKEDYLELPADILEVSSGAFSEHFRTLTAESCHIKNN